MSTKPSGIIKFQAQDDLVVAYHRSLSQGVAQLKTPRRLAQGENVTLRICVLSPRRELDVEVRVDEASTPNPDGSSFKSRVTLGSDSMQRLEEFILSGDVPAEPTRFSVVPRRTLTIVVVDDSKFHAENAAAPFRARGDNVQMAENGLIGLGQCIKHMPDVILSDVQMPKVDGWQLLRMLRSRPQFADTPIIFLTTLDSEHDRLLGYRLGVDDYLNKPYAPEALIAAVDRAVRARKTPKSGSLPAGEALKGQLDQVSLPALLAFLELEQQTGTIRLEPKGSALSVRSGRPVRARLGDRDSQAGDRDVVYDLLDTRRGRFEFRAGEVEPRDSISLPMSALLLEHARRADEASRVETTSTFFLDDAFQLEDPRCA
ncbi:MAG TPA: response regulator [Polyangiaceae bacterium]|nr:response regulator [Polyangiaceae bacterium]